ncbi:MAG: hypothetical protein ACE5J5_07385 [Candidatus Hydrothermarchaeales archaeon]
MVVAESTVGRVLVIVLGPILARVDWIGVFDIPVELPHTAHKAKLETGSMKCETCHVVGGEFQTPVPRPGEVLVCELCHSEGNFITIHIDGCVTEGNPNVEPLQYPRLDCSICHTDAPVDIHGMQLKI